MNVSSSIAYLLPDYIRDYLEKNNLYHSAEEVRMRAERPVELLTATGSVFFNQLAKKADILHILNMGSRNSLYAHEEEMRNGYITVRGGHRLGFTGEVIMTEGRIAALTHFNSLNIRFARELKGCSDGVIRHVAETDKLRSCLFVSPPGVGKTTLLRDIARRVSDGGRTHESWKTGLIDERGEIASCLEGIPQLDVGRRTDILDNCPKAEGVMMLIRTMSPQGLVTDAIGGQQDCEALGQAASCGGKIIASAHGHTLGELLSTRYIEKIITEKIFDRYIFIKREHNCILPTRVYTSDLKEEMYD
jgi:stage III sporulation protein AA